MATPGHAQLRESLQRAIHSATSRLQEVRATIASLRTIPDEGPPDPHDGDAQLPSESSALVELLQLVSTASADLETLDELVTSNSLSVFVVGPPKSGKSSLVNALLGAVCFPTGDDAATSRVLGEEAELLLHTPAGVSTCDGVSFKVIDSPGVKEDLAPNAHARWQQAFKIADVCLVVVPYESCGSPEEDELWRELAGKLARGHGSTQRVALFINEYDQTNVTEDEREVQRERARQARIKYVREVTNGGIVLLASQVFVGSARDAMVACTTQERTSDENVLSASEQENLRLSPHVYAASTTIPTLPDAAALQNTSSVKDWNQILRDSSIGDLHAFLRERTRGSVATHARSLLSLTQVHSSSISESAQALVDDLSGLENALRTKLGDVTRAKKLVQGYFDDELTAEDAQLCSEMRAALDQLRARLHVALDAMRRSTRFDALPERLELTQGDDQQLVQLLELFRQCVHTVVEQELAHFREQIQALVLRRQDLQHAFFPAVEQILSSHGISARPQLDHDRVDIVGATTELDTNDAIEQSLSWIQDFVQMDTDQLVQSAKLRVQRTSYSAAGQFRVDCDFFEDPTCDPQLMDNADEWMWDGGVCKLGYGYKFTAKFDVDAKFIGRPFKLELEHLTSMSGDDSRAAVTVTLNGTPLRTAFDPRAAHETEENKAGYYDYATDSWVIGPERVHAGQNVLQISYVSGSSVYWLNRWALTASLPATDRHFLRRDDVLTTTLATVLERLVPGDAHHAHIDKIIENTSPLVALRAISAEYAQVLSVLIQANQERLARCTHTHEVLTTVLEQCDALQEATLSNLVKLTECIQRIQQHVQTIP